MIKGLINFFLIVFLTLLIANTNVFAFHKQRGMDKTVYEDRSQKEVQSLYCTTDVKKKFVIRDDGRKAKDEEGDPIQIRNEDGKPAWTMTGYHDVEPRIPEEIFIPDEYINDLDVKMSIYKRISLIINNQERNNLMTELIDRFGQLPIEVENLFKLIEIKILCLKNNIEQIEFGRKGILLSFYKNKPFNPDKIIKIGTNNKKQITIRSDQRVFYDFCGTMNDDRFELVKKVIKTIV